MKVDMKNTLFYGTIFAFVSTIIWLCNFDWGRAAAIFLCAMAAGFFVIYLVVPKLTEKAPKPVKILSRVLSAAVVVIMLAYVLFTVLAAFAMFYPGFDERSNKILSENTLALDNYEELTIQTDSGNISGWRIHNEKDSAPLVLYFGGNAEPSSGKIYTMLINETDRTVFKGCNFVMLDMPGYGKSSGYPCESSLKDFGLKAYDYVKETYHPSKIIILGYSIGTGAANYVASQREIDALILMAPYADGIDLYNSRLNIFYGPARLWVAYQMEAIKFAENIRVKPLIFASDADEIVPYQSSERLETAYPEGSEFITISGIKHAYFWEDTDVLERIREYIAEVPEQ